MKITKIMNNTNLSKMIDNKYVLYFVFILSAIYLLGYLMSGNFSSIIFFVCFGFVTSLFSKNMTIVLSVPLILTSILMIGEKVKESFANMAKKNIQTQLIETQTQINDMIANGVNTPQQKNALKIKNDKLKKILKQIHMKPGMLKKPKVTVVKKQVVVTKPTVASSKTTTNKK